MNSIKNAIVTVTLLTVGYGSYVVLQDPSAGKLSDPGDPGNGTSIQAALTDMGHVGEEIAVPDISIGKGQTSRNEQAVQQDSQALVTTETVAEPELPPLPDLIQPNDEAANDPIPQLTSPANQPAVTDADENLIPADVEPPVAAVDRPSSAEVAKRSSPFAEPLTNQSTVETELGVEASSGILLSKIDTIADSSLGSVPPNAVTPEDFTPTPSANAIPQQNASFELAWTETQQHLTANDLPKALLTLSPWYSEATLTKDQESRCLQLLDQLAGTVIYSRESLMEPAHEVKAGQTLEAIADAYSVSDVMLAKINGISPPYALTIGERLKVVRGPFRATVSLFKSQLTLFAGPCYAGRFPVTIGSDLPPEPAFYEVAEKSRGRNYFDRRLGREILSSEEGNRYGRQWLGLRGEHITTGHSVGIHGRPLKFTEGDVGSISLAPADAEDIYSILSVGDRIEVRP